MSTQQIEGTVIDIAATFQAIYGYLPAQAPTLPAAQNTPNPFNIPTRILRQQSGTISPVYNESIRDMINRPVFMPIILTVTDLITKKSKDYNFPFCIMEVKNQKALKETGMTERGGVVIEEIALGAWEFDVKGFLIDPQGIFPDDQLILLNNLYSNNVTNNLQTIELKCALSDIFLQNNGNVVMKNLLIPSKGKVIGVKDFSFTLIQESILDLYKID